ncbi:MAG: serine protease [Trichodesmium sp. MAG_R01]|nr:serine protease [Trichodesmium sp. MAG_R01]
MRNSIDTGRLYELFRSCIVRIKTSKTFGTGFWVTPGHILTCVHVIEENDHDSIEIVWKQNNYQFTEINIFQDADLALLKVEIESHPCVFLDEDALPGDELYSYGYPEQKRDGASITMICEGPTDNKRFLTVKDENVRPGFSGAPLFNQRTFMVCGVLKSERKFPVNGNVLRALGGQAIPTARIFDKWPNLKISNQEFHQKYQNWRKELEVTKQQEQNSPQYSAQYSINSSSENPRIQSLKNQKQRIESQIAELEKLSHLCNQDIKAETNLARRNQLNTQMDNYSTEINELYDKVQQIIAQINKFQNT